MQSLVRLTPASKSSFSREAKSLGAALELIYVPCVSFAIHLNQNPTSEHTNKLIVRKERSSVMRCIQDVVIAQSMAFRAISALQSLP